MNNDFVEILIEDDTGLLKGKQDKSVLSTSIAILRDYLDSEKSKTNNFDNFNYAVRQFLSLAYAARINLDDQSGTSKKNGFNSSITGLSKITDILAREYEILKDQHKNDASLSELEDFFVQNDTSLARFLHNIITYSRTKLSEVSSN
jgi:hypothetical protein